MTQTDGPLAKFSEHLYAVARGARGRRLVARLAAAGIGVECGADLRDVLGRGSAPPEPDTALVECLAAWVARDELCALALLHLLRPRLELMAAQLARRDETTVDDAECDVLSAGWEILTRRRPPGRGERLEAVWTEARRATRVRRKERTVSFPEGFERPAPEEPDAVEHWPGLPDAAVSAGVLTCSEVALIVRTRVEGGSLRQAARDLGRPYDALRMERRRAEAALRAYATSSGALG